MLSNLLCRCEDYILIERGGSHVEICGNISSIPTTEYVQPNNFTVIFRTSESVQGDGFLMGVICYVPEIPGIMHTCIIMTILQHNKSRQHHFLSEGLCHCLNKWTFVWW